MPDWANEALKFAIAAAFAFTAFLARKLWGIPARQDKIESEQSSFVREQALAPELATMRAEMDDMKREIERLRDHDENHTEQIGRLEGANDGRQSTNRRR